MAERVQKQKSNSEQVTEEVQASEVTETTAQTQETSSEMQEEGEKQEGEAKDPYQGAFFVLYKRLLNVCLRYRWVSVISVVIAFILSIGGFGYVKQSS